MDEEGKGADKANTIGSKIAAALMIVVGLVFLLASACFGFWGIAFLSSSVLWALVLIAFAVGSGFIAVALFKASRRNL